MAPLDALRLAASMIRQLEAVTVLDDVPDDYPCDGLEQIDAAIAAAELVASEGPRASCCTAHN